MGVMDGTKSKAESTTNGYVFVYVSQISVCVVATGGVKMCKIHKTQGTNALFLI